MTTLMMDALNTPALAPVELLDVDAVQIISSMLETGVPIQCRAFPLPLRGENITVFWSETPRGQVATVWEHTRHDAFNVPMGDGDRSIETLRFRIQDASYAQYDRDTEYAVGE